MTGLLFLHIGMGSTRQTVKVIKDIKNTKDKAAAISMYLFEDLLIEEGFVTMDQIMQFRKLVGYNGKRPQFYTWSESKYTNKLLSSLKVNGVARKLHMTFGDEKFLIDSLCHYTVDKKVDSIEELCGLMKNMMFVWMSEVFFIRRLNSFLMYSTEELDANQQERYGQALLSAKQEWELYLKRYYNCIIATAPSKNLGNLITIPVIKDNDFKVVEWNKCMATLDRITSSNVITI